MSEQKSICIALAGGTLDKLFPASIIASGGVMNDARVDIFLTFWGLMAFRKGAPATVQNMSQDDENQAQAFMQVMQQKQVPSWYDTLLQAKEMGDVHVHACGMVSDLFDLKLDDFEPIVDDIIGVGEFAEMAMNADTTLYIG